MDKIIRFFNSKKTIKKLEELYPEGEAKKRAVKLARYKCRVFTLTLLISVILTCVYAYFHSDDGNVDRLLRNDYGKGSRDVSLTLDYEGLDRAEKRVITVEEKRYSEKELSDFAEEIEKIIWDEVKGDNPSLDEVTKDLYMPNSMNGYPFSISYKSEKPLILSNTGVINREKLREELENSDISAMDEGILVRVCASLSYYDFKEDIYAYVNLKIDRSNSLANFREDLNRAITYYDEKSLNEDYQILPGEVDGIKVSFTRSKSYESYMILMLGIVSAILLVISKDKELEKEVNKRNKELEMDYVGILDQYTLYYIAGMSHRRIWQEICRRYEKEIQEGSNKRAAFEEMLRCNKRMNEGMGEIAAYEEFANRCHLVKYRAFINLIEQSVKKGQGHLDSVLEEEVEKARREENNRVRMLSQELSTKLLLPMIMMLIIVLIIVMVPAFISFN